MIDATTDSELSRRSLVKTAATAAAAGGVLVLAGPAGTARAESAPEQLPATRISPEHHSAPGDGVLVRVLDEHLGTLEVYTERGHRTVTDRTLAAQLGRLAR